MMDCNTNFLQFTPFSRLPTEFRWKIWQYAALDSPGRIVPLQRNPSNHYTSASYFRSLSPYPSLANTCCEARQIIHEVLQPLFTVPRWSKRNFCGFIAADLSKDTVGSNVNIPIRPSGGWAPTAYKPLLLPS
jgi:hypothetical protein